jgi:type VI secretion system protein ImpK
MNWSRCFGCVAVVGLSALLGACGPSKTEVAAKAENEELRSQQAELVNRLNGVEGNVNTLASDVAVLKSKPAAPVANDGGSFQPQERDRKGAGSSGRRVDLGVNLFPSGSDQLTPTGKKSVDDAVRGISKGASITVEGFADSTPIKKSKFASNQALSEARARSVASYLRGKGFSIADSVGMGSVSRNGKAPSRRVELVVAE